MKKILSLALLALFAIPNTFAAKEKAKHEKNTESHGMEHHKKHDKKHEKEEHAPE